MQGLRVVPLLTAAVVTCVLSTYVDASVISIDFGSGKGAVTGSQTAGVVSVGNWNNFTQATQTTAQTLISDDGAATTAKANWSVADGTWVPGGLTPGFSSSTGDYQLFLGFLGTNWNTKAPVITVTNIPYAQYDVYVYVTGQSTGKNQTVQLTNVGTETGGIGDTSTKTFTTTNASTYTAAGNYLLFSNNTADNLNVIVGYNTTSVVGVAGIQIVEVVPEPASIGVLATAGLGLLFFRRKSGN